MKKLFALTVLAITSALAAGAQTTINGTNQNVSGYSSPNNVMQFACGVPINDGNFHPVNTAGGCFSGVTNLAGIAAITINGAHPFALATDSGTTIGPLCTFGTTTNCFTSSGGTYKLTDTLVSNGTIDVGWLAMQACALVKDCELVPGTYKINLTLMVPISLQNIGGVNIYGAGPQVTVIVPNRDFGTGVPLVSCGDPSGTSGNSLGRYAAGNGECAGNLANLALKWTGTAPSIGSPNVNMDGLAWGARLNLTNVEIDFFNHGRTVVGDQSVITNLRLFGNYIGDYNIAPNSVLLGNIADHGYDNQSILIARSVVAGATISETFDQKTYMAAPFIFYGEAAAGGGCTPILNGAKFDGLQTEFTSIAFLQDASVLPGQLSNGTSYNDTAACRGAVNLTIRDWFFSFQYSNDSAIHTAFPNYVRRAAVDAYNFDQVQFTGFNSNGGNINPNGGTIGAAQAFFYLQRLGDVTGTGVSFSGAVDAFISGLGTIPVLHLPSGNASMMFTLDQPGVWSGYMAQMSGFNPNASYTTVTKGDCIEYYAQIGFWANPCGTGNLGIFTPVLGVAKQTGIAAGQATSYLPLCTSGFCNVNMGWSIYPSSNSGLIKASTGIRTATYVGGTTGTTGTYNWTSSAGPGITPATGTITVAGGTITALTVTNIGNHFTAQPSIPLPSGTGLTGASITAIWPSGMGANATDPTDGPIFGMLVQGASGSSATGNLVNFIRLQPPNGALNLNSLVAATRTVTAATDTVTATDYGIKCNATSNAETESLPATPTQGQVIAYSKVDTSANICTLSGNGHNIRNGATSASALVLSTATSFLLQYDSADSSGIWTVQ